MKSKKNLIWDYIYGKFNKSVSDLNSLYNHQAIKGRENEDVLINFLKSFIPRKFELTRSPYPSFFLILLLVTLLLSFLDVF